VHDVAVGTRDEVHDGRAWRARAEECRAIADTFENPETRAKMLTVAADYERMTENAEWRELAAASEGAAQRGNRVPAPPGLAITPSVTNSG
jgi:hypothetical protein